MIARTEEILDFIHRRFPNEDNWMTGNCFWFAQILRSRFGGMIMYDPIAGHFLLFKNSKFFDWSGERLDYRIDDTNLIDWDNYQQVDKLHYEKIIRDVVL